jgi:uncharacterized damage-inducible protein DinB
MNYTVHVKTMAVYNRWMNEKIYDCCSQLTDEQRKRDAGAFFKSIHGTLNHILLADRVWMGRFTNCPVTFKSLDQELYSEFDELRKERIKTDRDIIAWVADLNVESPEQMLTFTPMTNPQPRTMPLWQTISHFFNHQTHHRGQITTLLFQQGIDPGVTDLAAMPVPS